MTLLLGPLSANYVLTTNNSFKQLNVITMINFAPHSAVQNEKNRWWRTVKYFLNRNKVDTIPSLLDGNDHVTDNLSKAEIFNSFFLRQCTLDSSTATLPEHTIYPHNIIRSISVSDEEVLDILRSLDVSKATGPDGISARLLKKAAPVIYKSLAKLLNLSLRKNTFPSKWKFANAIPIHK